MSSEIKKRFPKLEIYKTKSAMQVSVRYPYVSKSDGEYEIYSKGGIFLEFAPSNGVKSYDWSDGKKIKFLLGIFDIGKVMSVLTNQKETVDIFHDPGANSPTAGNTTKNLKISKGTDQVKYPGSYNINITENNKGTEPKIVSIGLSMDESIVIRELLRHSIGVIMSW